MQDRDAAISDAIHRSLDHNLSLPKGRIDVDVIDGWVTLGGALDWDFQRQAAEYVAREVAGVTGISNNLTINPNPDLHEGWGTQAFVSVRL